MSSSLTIPKKPVYPASMDFQRLRREGIRHIERLGSAIWTDYNDHDPGITMLEVLDYAITDLGYRTHWPAADLFALPTNRHPYPTAAEILTTGPVTALDLRKLLIDLDGVRNAWIQCQAEPDVWITLVNDLTLDQVNKILDEKLVQVYGEIIPGLANANAVQFLQSALKELVIAAEKDRQTKFFEIIKEFTTAAGDSKSALYQALVLFTTDQRFDEAVTFLNDRISVAPDKKSLEDLLKAFKKLKKLLEDYQKDKNNKTSLTSLVGVVEVIPNLAIPDPKIADYFVGYALFQLLQPYKLIANKKPDKAEVPTPNLYNLFTPRGIYSVLLEIEETAEEDAEDIKQAALARLHQYRNLGEDIDPVVKVLDTEPVGVCATLNLAPEADPDAVLAAVIAAIDNYLAPPVRFYTLQERLDKYGRFQLTDTALANLTDAALPTPLLTALNPLVNQETVSKAAFLDTIRQAIGDAALADYEALIFFHTVKTYDSHPVYQGPLLTHGFLDEDELEAAQLRRTIYKSDLYQVVRQVPGVTGVENLEMFHCQHGVRTKLATTESDWCLSFDCECQLRFDPDCSRFHYARGGNYIKLDAVRAALEARWQQGQHTFSVARPDDLDLAPPTARFRPDFLDYTSVQEDFPRTYHVGREGLAANESELRRAQVRQMKGYLVFYDQLLVNYLAQLANVRDLLAIDGSVRQPAGFLSLTDIVPNGGPLWLDYDAAATDPAFRELMYGTELAGQLYQSQLLNHLLARFGEQFTDYVLALYQSDKLADDGDLVNDGLTNWLTAKQNLLTNLPRLGRERARGFNYRAAPATDNTHIWNPNEARQPPTLFANVEGLKQRVCALLGIADASRHTITGALNVATDVFLSPETRAKRYRFGLKMTATDPQYVLTSTAWFAKPDAADQALQAFENQSLDTSKYGITEDPDVAGQWVLGFWPTSVPVEPDKFPDYTAALMRSQKTHPKDDAAERLARLKKRIEATNQDDSFHVLEHILLQPRNEHYAPLLTPMVLDSPDIDPAHLDPYSFRLSVIVPDWVDRYRDERRFYEFSQTLRAETPAHLAVRICRYNRVQMLAFETAYYAFLVEQSFPQLEPADLYRVTNELVRVLNDQSGQCTTTNPQKPARPVCLPTP